MKTKILQSKHYDELNDKISAFILNKSVSDIKYQSNTFLKEHERYKKYFIEHYHTALIMYEEKEVNE